MFVQNYHLKTRWAFEAISEQVKLLHLKLQRTVALCASVIPRDLQMPEEQRLISEITRSGNNISQDNCE
jgi:hypothetical protein